MLIEDETESLANRLLVFLHLVKTGGVSLHGILEDVFGDDYFRHSQTKQVFLDSLDDERKQQLKCISGHFRFGVHKKLSREALYVTVVREPIERMISLYNHKLRDGKLKKAAGDQQSIDQWMWDRVAERGKKVYTQCEAICGHNRLEPAVEILDRHFLLYCSMNQLSDMAVVLQEYLGVQEPQSLKRTHAHPGHLEKSVPSSPVVEAMRKKYEPDIRLNQYCHDRFQQVLSHHGRVSPSG